MLKLIHSIQLGQALKMGLPEQWLCHLPVIQLGIQFVNIKKKKRKKIKVNQIKQSRAWIQLQTSNYSHLHTIWI